MTQPNVSKMRFFLLTALANGLQEVLDSLAVVVTPVEDPAIRARFRFIARKIYEAQAQSEEGVIPWGDIDVATQDEFAREIQGIIRGLTQRELHVSWLADARANGWAPGPPSIIERTHPAIVPWEELPDEDRSQPKLYRVLIDTQQGRIGGGRSDFISENFPDA